MSRLRAFAAAAVVMLTSSCTGILSDQRLRELTLEISKRIETLTLTLPGARYNLLIEDIASGDPDRQTRARAFVKNLFNVNLDATYQVTAWFSFAPTSGLRADIVQANTFTEAEIRRLAQEPFLLQNAVVNSAVFLPTPEEREAQIRSSLRSAIDLLSGTLGPPLGGLPYQISREATLTGPRKLNEGLNSSLQPEPGWKERETARDAADRDRFVSLFENAISKYYEPLSIPLGSASLSLPWAPARGPYVFVVVDKEDFEIHRQDLQVQLLLHESSATQKPFNNFGVKHFATSEFRGPVRVENLGRDVVWAVQNVTGVPGLDPELIKRVRELEGLTRELEELTRRN